MAGSGTGGAGGTGGTGGTGGMGAGMGGTGAGGFSGSFGHISPAAGTGSYGPLGVKGSGGGTTASKKASARRQSKKSKAQELVNLSKFLNNMKVSEEGVPYQYVVSPDDPGQDPGHLRPPTRQDIAYGERLDRATQLKESGRLPGGRDPVAVEQNITAAERQTPTWRDEGDSLRESIYGQSLAKKASVNMGNMLTSGYKGTLGQMLPFAALPGGAMRAADWGAQPNQAEGWAEKRIVEGEGTPHDQSKSWNRKLDVYKAKYYGQPDPGPRPRNVYDNLGMSQPKPPTPMMDFGQNDVPMYLTSAGKSIDNKLGPYKVAPPGSETGLPPGALAHHGLHTRPFFTNEQNAMLQSQPDSVAKLSPQMQDYVKRLSAEPENPPMIDFSGGKKEKEEEEEKKTFNLLEMLMQLLGLGGKGSTGGGSAQSEGGGSAQSKVGKFSPTSRGGSM